jgi:chemotaxis methyl-accepting protein methylase
LIHVTSFFREPEAFELLKTQIFPKICALREGAVRVWIPACSTGEEAYSLAICLLEFLGQDGGSFPIQIFGTDVSEESIDAARRGFFPDGIAADVPQERLRRFFSKVENGFRVKQSVREICVFARQDVTRDPPFSRLDLILCRNLLIYLTAPAQKRLLNVFHYALKPHGFLMLGDAETVGSHADLFTAVDKKRKVYARRQIDTPMHLDVALSPRHVEARHATKGKSDAGGLSREASRIILDRFAPPSVVVDSELQIVEIRGRVATYLELPTGRATLDVVKLAREGLGNGLRTTLHEAKKSQSRVRREGIRVRHDANTFRVSVEIVPLADEVNGRYFLIVFDEEPGPGAPSKRRREGPAEAGQSDHGASRVGDLEAELETTREHMQTVIQDLEAANEELQSANEEVLSSNEELQSTNEELDTAREELQSTNEELNTVNDELQHRNQELMHVNSDLVNLLASVHIAIVILASDLTIRRFTPMAERVLNLLPTDVGRPIGHIKPNIQCGDLEALIRRVIDDMAPMEREVQDEKGRWYSLRVRPYKNVENQIDGAVLLLFDVTVAKQNEAARDARTRLCRSDRRQRARAPSRAGRGAARALLQPGVRTLVRRGRERRTRRAAARRRRRKARPDGPRARPAASAFRGAAHGGAYARSRAAEGRPPANPRQNRTTQRRRLPSKAVDRDAGTGQRQSRRVSVVKKAEFSAKLARLETQGEAVAALRRSVVDLEIRHEELRAENEQLDDAQAALALASAHYRELFDAAPFAYLVLNDLGAIEEVNSAGRRAARSRLARARRHAVGGVDPRRRRREIFRAHPALPPRRGRRPYRGTPAYERRPHHPRRALQPPGVGGQRALRHGHCRRERACPLGAGAARSRGGGVSRGGARAGGAGGGQDEGPLLSPC